MDGPGRTSALSSEDLAKSAERSIPRVLFIRCRRDEAEEQTAVRWSLVESLANEDWPIEECQLPKTALRFSSKGIPGKIIGRFVAKFDYLRRVVKMVPNCDIVHIAGGTPNAIARLALPAIVLAKFYGKKVILHLYSARSEQFFEKQAIWFHPILRSADRIVVGSRYLQKVIERARLEAARVTAPVMLKDITHRTVTRLQPRILVNCPLNRESNVSCALRAFRMVKEKYPRAEMVIAGDGSREYFLQQAVSATNTRGVEFVGTVSDSQLGALYADADLFLNSSSIDESPSSIALAFAAGLPVVATDADGLLHMVRDRVNALVVPVGDAVGLTNRIFELIETPKLTERLSRAGRDEARAYTWPRLRQDWVNVYTRLSREA